MRTSVSCTYGVCEMNCGGVKTLEIGSASPSIEEVVVMGCGLENRCWFVFTEAGWPKAVFLFALGNGFSIMQTQLIISDKL